jgi:predicted nucleic acid-binding Zn ribbon protein
MNYSCIRCGALYQAKPSKGKQYCSKACYLAARKEAIAALVCDHCGMSYVAESPSHAKRRERHFCSWACFVAAERLRNLHLCLVCSQPMKRGRRACSNRCRGILARKSRPTCRICGNSCRTGRFYCSRQCAGLAHSERMTGTGNSRYRDGQGSKPYHMHFKSKVRPSVLAYGATCQRCGGTPAHPLVHHKNGNPQDDTPSNLEVLCRPCHTALHKSAEWKSRQASPSTTSA